MGDSHKKREIRPKKVDSAQDKHTLRPAARRALREAEERRKARKEQPDTAAAEVGGRKGPEPVRYGDWEKDGIVSDF